MSNPFLGENAAVPAESSGERPHRHAIEQASRRWRGGRRDDSARTRRKILISTQRANAASRSTRDRRPPPRSGPSTASAVEPVEASVRGAEHRRRHASALVQVLKPNLDARRDFVSYCAYYVTVPAKIEHVPSRSRCARRGEQRAMRCARPPAVDGKNKNSMTHVMNRSPECRAQNLLPWGPGSLAHLGATRGRLSLSARARKLNSWMRYAVITSSRAASMASPFRTVRRSAGHASCSHGVCCPSYRWRDVQQAEVIYGRGSALP